MYVQLCTYEEIQLPWNEITNGRAVLRLFYYIDYKQAHKSHNRLEPNNVHVCVPDVVFWLDLICCVLRSCSVMTRTWSFENRTMVILTSKCLLVASISICTGIRADFDSWKQLVNVFWGNMYTVTALLLLLHWLDLLLHWLAVTCNHNPIWREIFGNKSLIQIS